MFKIGDEVRIKENAPREDGGHEVGTIGIITEICDGSFKIRDDRGINMYNRTEDLELLNAEVLEDDELKVGDLVECIDEGDRGAGWLLGRQFIIKILGSEVAWESENGNGVYINSLKKVEKFMKLSEYKKVAKVGERIIVKLISFEAEGEVGDINPSGFYFLNNDPRISGGHKIPKGSPYQYSYFFDFNDTSVTVKIMENKTTKKRKAYIEITKETGNIFINLKIPLEIEEFFKSVSGGETQESNAWYSKGKGVIFYKQTKEIEKKLTDIEDYVFSDYGSGLMRDNFINVSILRSVGASKGIKINSKAFSSFTNADLQEYVRRLGLYIKKLWESNISSTKIKSVITFEI